MGERRETAGEKADCPRGRRSNIHWGSPTWSPTCQTPRWILSLWRAPLSQDEDSTLPHPQVPAIIPQRRQHSYPHVHPSGPLAHTGVTCPSPTLAPVLFWVFIHFEDDVLVSIWENFCVTLQSPLGTTPSLPSFFPSFHNHMFSIRAVPQVGPRMLPHSSS